MPARPLSGSINPLRAQPVQLVTIDRQAILSRPFTLLEAAYLVATEEEWGEYKEVGNERGLFEHVLPDLWKGTRFGTRLELELKFWARIQKSVADQNWRAYVVGPQGKRTLDRIEIAAYFNPFITRMAEVISQKTADSQLIFEKWSQSLEANTKMAEPAANHGTIPKASASDPTTSRNFHADKAQLRAELQRWFETMVANDHPPQRRSAWLAKAKRQFSGRGLTDNLFKGAWDELGHPHSLKLSGRGSST